MEEVNHIHEEVPGNSSFKPSTGRTMDEFCEWHIPGYNRHRFDVLAFRVHIGESTLLTVFAIDKGRQKGNDADREKMPVKSFKINSIPAAELLNFCASFNMLLTSD